MAASKGLSVDGVNYFSSFMSGEKKPDWMQFGKTIGQLTGDYKVMEFITGFSGLQQFVFRTPRWPIGGMYFDGILRTEHTSRVRTTNYPVQTGVVMTDHAIVEPAELTIDVMMTDTATDSLTGGDNLGSFVGMAANHFLGAQIGGILGSAFTAYQKASSMKMYSNYMDLSCKPVAMAQPGETRSINAWQALKTMQLERVPITVETRLQNYSNMIIEELSAPDDYKTLHALKCTVRLREIIFANVAETQVSARPSSTAGESAGGATPVDVPESGTNETALGGIKRKAEEVFA